MSAPNAASALHGLRVLVTRPSGRADELLAAITAFGGRAEHIPLLAVTPLNELRDAASWQRTRQHVLELDRYQRVIAISVNAVHYGLQWIENYWPQLPWGIAWYGIGAATVAELARFDIIAHSGPVTSAAAPMNSEALLARPELQQLDGERILILRGVGGRETLAETLRERGARVDYAECYRRVEPELDAAAQRALREFAFDAVCVNSAETLMNLWQRLDPAARLQLQQCAVIVPSARVATLAGTLGLRRVCEAANAGTAATMTTLRDIAVTENNNGQSE